MKLKLDVDAGYAFDFLSILGVKYIKTRDSQVAAQFVNCGDSLSHQIGRAKYAQIMASKEYDQLFDANSTLFDYVDKVKIGEVTGKQVDDMVYVRWQKKKALQEKFFPESEYGEKKYGY